MKNQAVLLAAIAMVFLGAPACSKKNSATPPPPAAAEQTPAAVATAPAQANAATTPPRDVNQLFSAADAAMRQKAYDDAAKALIAAQAQKNLSAQQAAEARNRMVGFQRGLAEAVTSGDPRARAAAEMLRQASMR